MHLQLSRVSLLGVNYTMAAVMLRNLQPLERRVFASG